MQRVVVVALLWTSLCGCALVELKPRPRPPAPPARTTQVELAVATTTLPSGLRVVTVSDPRASEVQVTMRYGFGSTVDGRHPGIAHLVEHLMFQHELDGEPVLHHLDEKATFFNGTTSFDATTYVSRGPVTALDTLLAIEALRLERRCAGLDNATFDHERQIVLNELEQRDQASEVFNALHRALYGEGHPYQQPVGGSVASVSAITREQACSFADRWYAPSNAVLVVSGPLDAGRIDVALAAISRRITKRAGAQLPVAPPQLIAKYRESDTSAPIDDDVVVLAWPLPADPGLRARVRAIASALPRLVDAEVKGTVVGVELGDTHAPMVGIALLRDEGETLVEVFEGTRRGINNLTRALRDGDPEQFDDVVFDRMKQGSIFQLYAGLEDGSGRDERLASAVLAGRDARTAVADDIAAVRELGRRSAVELANKYLGVNDPTVVVVAAAPGKKRGEKVSLRAPAHEIANRRMPADPALASKPAERAAAPISPPITRTLPNGLKVVLLPVSTAPTVDARLIFNAGSADEPSRWNGVAMLAAHGLTWDLHHIKDAIAFVRAGGMRDTDVSTDRTTFSVQGLDSHLDVVLAGLRRWVRDGVYDASAKTFVRTMHRAAKRNDDQGLLTDQWRASLFGAQHPYVRAGLARHSNNALTLEDARTFRAAFYTPDNATLVIAGRFDPVLANRWIDFLFTDWAGRAGVRHSMPVKPQPSAIAKRDDTSLVQLRIAIPTSTNNRAQHLVAAAMLSGLARDVRYRLGASYTFDAYLAENRFAGFYVMAGFVAATRTKAAVDLLAERIRELRDDEAARARAFVVARRRVLVQLQSRITSASALADRVQRDVELGRPPLTDLQVADAVATLTVEDMSGVFEAIDLARSTVLMDGPDADIEAAFQALGRTPSYVDTPTRNDGHGPGATPPELTAWEQQVLIKNIQPALTLQPPPRVAVTASVTGTAAFVADHFAETFTGYSIVAGVGYRYGWGNAIGAHINVARLTLNSELLPNPVSLTPINIAAMWHLGSDRRYWADVLVGLHIEQLDDERRAAPMWGLQGGYDLGAGFGIVVRWEQTFRDTLDYMAVSFGVGFHR
jgi:zinc protease